MADQIGTSAGRQRALKALERGAVVAPNGIIVRGKGPSLRFSVEGGKGSETLYLTRLVHVPNLLEPLSHAIALYNVKRSLTSRASRRSLYDLLAAGLVSFLQDTGRSECRLRDLDRQTLSAFIRWLNRTNDGLTVLRRSTRRAYYEAVLSAVELLRCEAQFAPDLLPIPAIPLNPWPNGIEPPSHPESALSEVQLKALFVAAATAVREISAVVTQDLSLIDGKSVSDPLLAERQAVLKQLVRLFGAGTRGWRQLQKADAEVAKHVSKLGRDDILRSLRPSLADIAPFIILFAIMFRFNDSVLLSCRRSDFTVKNWIGGERIFAHPWKPRAGRRQTASAAATAEAVNPKQMLALLDRWASRLRDVVPGDEVFLYWSTNSRRPGAVAVNASTDPWITNIVRRAIQAFADAANVGAIVTITRIRDAVLELAHQKSGGNILLVKAAGSHKSADTTADHYVSAAGRAREDEALAKALRLQTAMVANRGRFDPRREGDQQSLACTPGWDCSRATEPPPEGNRGDGLCVAYGRCPICRHGKIDFHSPRACAQTHLLVEAIERAADKMDPEGWLARLAPVRMHILENILPYFPVAIHQRAARLSLPPLPLPE